MLNYLYRLKAKKAFTMVELIVVIAIIGILLALILPSMLTSEKPTKAKGYAKSYFYTVQDFMCKQRIVEDPDAPTINATLIKFCLYTTVDSSGNVVESGVVSHISNTMTDSVTYQSSGAEQGLKDLVRKFAQDMRNNVTSTEFAGTFYVVIDTDFRVQAAYWSDGLITELASGNSDLEFSDNNEMNGYVCAAYPVRYSTVDGSGATGRKMFIYD